MKGESTLATGSFDASVGVWRKEKDDGGEKGGFSEEVDYTSGAGGEQDEADDEEWRFALVLDGHDSEVKSVSWSAGGNFLATCSRDKSVWIWEEVGDDDFETIAVLQEHSGDVKCVAWHPEEELLASASYDDDVRLWREDLDDWTCVAILGGHDSTVWMVDWESVAISPTLMEGKEQDALRESWIKRRETSGSRLASCSDDMTIRIWRRKPREKSEQNKMSIIKTGSIEEDWVEEAQLPKAHERAIYSISWSKKTGRLASTGSDGRIVVYEEVWQYPDDSSSIAITGHQNGVAHNDESRSSDEAKGDVPAVSVEATRWRVVASLEGAHGVFEVNNVTWAKRADKGKREDEEVIVSTGDDGVVKVWALES